MVLVFGLAKKISELLLKNTIVGSTSPTLPDCIIYM